MLKDRKSGKIEIRKARAEDLKAIMNLEYQCFDRDTVEDLSVYEERLRVFGDGFLVLVVDGSIAGFITSELWKQNRDLSVEHFALGHSVEVRFDPDGDDLYISSLAVSPAHRGKKYGDTLVQALLREISASCQKVNRFILLVGSEWHGARRIYERKGFTYIGEFKNFFGGRNVASYNGLVMVKETHRMFG